MSLQPLFSFSFTPSVSSYCIFPVDIQTSVADKLSYFQTQRVVDENYLQAYVQCVEKDDEIVPKKLDHFVEELAHGKSLPKDMLQRSLETRLQEEIQRKYDQKAVLCRHLLDYVSSGTQDSVINEINPSIQTDKKLFEWYQESQSMPTAITEPNVFNALYQQIDNGKINKTDIAEAYYKNTISATDALRLTEHFCSAKSKPRDSRGKILAATIVDLCRLHHLNEEETAQAQYLIFSSGYDWKDHFAAAQELKAILTLQESKK